MEGIHYLQGHLVTSVQLDGLQDTSYMGMLRVSGATRSSHGQEFLLYGKKFQNQETTEICVGPSPTDFRALTRSIALRGESGAHNLHVIDDDWTHDRLQDVMSHQIVDGAFAIGGQYTHLGMRRCASRDGIYLYSLRRGASGWFVERCRFLVDGAHPGVMERRPKCHGYGEFDGQSTIVHFATTLLSVYPC